MLVEWIYDLIHNIDIHGLRWGVAITLYALIRKERRNFYLDKRDDAIFQNQKLIMEHLGLREKWRGHLTMSKADQQNFKRLYLSLHRGIQSVSQLKRRITMNKTWLVTLVTYILAQIAIRTGVVIPTEMANWIVDGLMLLIPIALAFMNKTKEVNNAKRPTDTGSAV